VVLGYGCSASAQTRIYVTPSKPTPPPHDNTVVQVCVGSPWCSVGSGGPHALSYEDVAAYTAGHCKKTVITTDASSADYALKTSYDESFRGGLSIVLLDRSGNVAYAARARHIHGAFKAMCEDFLEKKAKR